MSGEKTLSLFARNVPRDPRRSGPRAAASAAAPGHRNRTATSRCRCSRTGPSTRRTSRSASCACWSCRRRRRGKAQYEAVDLGEFLDAEGDDRRGIFLVRVQAWDPRRNRRVARTTAATGTAPRQPVGCAPARRHRSRPGDETLGRRLARCVRAIDRDRRTGGGRDRRDHRTQRPARAQRDDGRRRPRALSGSQELQERARSRCCISHGAAATARSCRSTAATARWISRASTSAAWKAVPTAPRSPRICSPIAASTVRVRRSARLRSCATRTGAAISIACRCGSKSRIRAASSFGARPSRRAPAGFGEILHSRRKESSPTGTYTLSLSIVRSQYDADLIGSTTVQVRDFLPDRLRMKAGFSTEALDGWVAPETLDGYVHLENLFGTPAENRRITAQLTLNPSIPSFRAFPDYSSTIRSTRAKATRSSSPRRPPTRKATRSSRSICSASRARRIACTSSRKDSKRTADAA